MRLLLKPHADTPSEAVAGLQVEIARSGADTLLLAYELSGALDELLIPAAAPPARRDGLWQHTCFEAFIAPEGSDAYWEFNFAPSGEWAAYRLGGYRREMSDAFLAEAPAIEVEPGPDGLRIGVQLRTGLPGDVVWRVGLSAVIEDRQGVRSFWALKHPPGEPDFHSPDCFALELAPPPRP